MPLYIKDPAVDTLLEEYLAAAGLKNKTEALRRVLTDQLKVLAEKESLSDRIAKIQLRATEAGFGPGRTSEAESKAFMDSMWGED